MIPSEDNNFKNKSIEDLKFVPFKDALNLQSPVMVNNNDNNLNSQEEGIYTFPQGSKNNNELYSYNESRKLRCPSDMIKDMKMNFDDDLIREGSSIKIDKIFDDIKNLSPGTLTLMEAYNIPFPIAKLIGRRFIKLTLDLNKGVDNK